MLHHVMFGASNAFVSLLASKGVNKDMQFLSDGKFYRNASLALVDVFRYKVNLS